MMGMKNHHLANNAAIIVAGKNHQWELKLVDEIMRNRTFA